MAYKYILKLLQEINATIDHPLMDSLLKKENDSYKKFLFEIDSALNILYQCENQKYNQWFEKKKKILSSNNIVDFSSVAGELRAFYHLHNSSIHNSLICSISNGSDFCVDLNKQKINIEVNTPLGASERRVNKLGESHNRNVKSEMQEEAPFGFPERKSDTFFSEFCSAINSIKQDEHQFEDEAINILWVDMLNPYLESMNMFNKELCEPFSLWQGQIHIGEIFFSLYSKKGDSIPTNFSLEWGTYRDYKMEYDCRLINSKSKVDYVIFNLYDGLFVFENIYNHRVTRTNEIYKFLYSMNIKIETSCLNFPQEDLCCKIQKIKNDVLKYKGLIENI